MLDNEFCSISAFKIQENSLSAVSIEKKSETIKSPKVTEISPKKKLNVKTRNSEERPHVTGLESGMAKMLRNFAENQKGAKTTLFVQSTSSGYHHGNFAKITLNHVEVVFEKNENGHDRGLHLAVVNLGNGGKVVFSKIFDTYKSCTQLDTFIKTQQFPPNSIIIAACKDDCSKNLSQTAK